MSAGEPTDEQIEAAIREFGKHCIVYPATWIAMRAVLARFGTRPAEPSQREACQSYEPTAAEVVALCARTGMSPVSAREALTQERLDASAPPQSADDQTHE